MAFTADEISNINNSALDTFLDKGTVFKQGIQRKPMLAAFEASAGTFPGGKEYLSWAVSSGKGDGQLTGYTGDQQLTFYNPTGTRRCQIAWKEHHIGIVVTHTELKKDGISVDDKGNTTEMDGREAQALANMLDEKHATLSEDFVRSLDLLIHNDGSEDALSLAGLQSIIVDDPSSGSAFGLSRSVNTWWRNWAATAAYGAAGGQGAITSSTENGGTLSAYLETLWRNLSRYSTGGTNIKIFAGADWIDAYIKEAKANGTYSQSGFTGGIDNSVGKVKFKGKEVMWDPTLEDLGLSKRAYFIDMGRTGLKLMYMQNERRRRHSPSRPHDRLVMYAGITTTGALVARRLNTSAVVDIA